MKKKWTPNYPKKLTKSDSPSKILRILTANRGISKSNIPGFLKPCRPPELKLEEVGINDKELNKAVDIIKQVGKKKKIIIYGDYDIDGLSAAAVLWEALWKSGYNVLPYIPNRKTGYGLKKSVIKQLINEHPDLSLIITVDNGIVAYGAVEYARKNGLKVIITDHHLVGSQQLEADAIIHSTEIAGCGVAWFLARRFGYQSTDLVALGTIGDLLPVTGINRSFVKFGLRELSRTNRPGINALKKIAGLEKNEELLPWQISFIIGPRLNASGRIDDPMGSLRLLCTKNQSRGLEIARTLDNLNKQRQEMTEFGVDLAEEILSKKDGIILVSGSDFHPGIIGLIAGKLTEKFYQPAIVVSQGEEISKGSARSIPGVDIVGIIRQAKDLLIDVGGHPMAAGFSLETKNLNKLFKKLQNISSKEIKKTDLIAKKEYDFEIDFSLINKRFYSLVQKLSPFGVGNPQPSFMLKKAKVQEIRRIGSNSKHLKLFLDDPETPKIEQVPADLAEAIGFGWGEWSEKINSGDLVNLIFNFNLNRWNGKEILQLKIKDIELC
jgi:single-stranded-DNA-specific exonuclease